jgi:hypothetical protein
MAGTETRIAGRERLWRIALALLPGLVLVLLRGVDANWDLRNYHLYNPHAWLAGRMLTDIAPAQLQTWHNPTLDLPLYWLATSGLDMRWTSLWLTLPFALAIYFLLELQCLVSPTRPGRGAQAALALLALSGAAVWSTIGNSMNDGFVAAAVLGGLVLVLRAEPAMPRHWLVAGLLAGGVMGLKLTASAYCLALAVTALAASGDVRARALRIAALGLGGVSGFLLTYGFWGATLYRLTGNPVFPYYNGIFGSDWLPGHDYADDRFRADGLGELLALPFQLLQKSVSHSELYLRDPRLLLALVGLLALPWLLRRAAVSPPLRERAKLLAVFAWSGFVLWALQYGIYRYAATLELLGALALVACIAWLPRGRGAVLALAFVAVAFATSRPDWGHSRYTAPRFAIPDLPVGKDAMVLTAGMEPIAYLALGLPREVPMVALANSIQLPEQCSGLQRRAREALRGHRGELWLAAEDAQALARSEQLARHWFKLERSGTCWEVPSALGTARLCPQRKAGDVPACPDSH